MKKLLKKIFRSEVGAGLVEYAILVALVAAIAAVGLDAFGDSLSLFFTNAGTGVGGLGTDVSP